MQYLILNILDACTFARLTWSHINAEKQIRVQRPPHLASQYNVRLGSYEYALVMEVANPGMFVLRLLHRPILTLVD